MTASRPSILTASSKAPSLAISSTMRKASLEAGVFGCASLILSAFSWDRTVVTTECPRSSKMSITCAAMKPLPPVFCCCQSCSSDKRMTTTEPTCQQNFSHIAVFASAMSFWDRVVKRGSGKLRDCRKFQPGR
jgi:hypothetical protein